MLLCKRRPGIRIEQNVCVRIARDHGVDEVVMQSRELRSGVTQRVERSAQWCTPRLVVFRWSGHSTATITFPTLDTVRATPRAWSDDDTIARCGSCDEFVGVDQRDVVSIEQRLDGRRECKLTELMVVSVTLHVGGSNCDAVDLGGVRQAVRERGAIVERAAERDVIGDLAGVGKDCD